jgi:hypothetical protein
LVFDPSVKDKLVCFTNGPAEMSARFVCSAGGIEKGLIEIFSGGLIALTRKIMRLQSFICCATCLALSSVCAVAGSAAGSSAQIGPTDNNTSVSTYKVTETGVGANARDSAGASASQAGGPSGTSSTGASSTDASSSNGAASSNGSAPSTFGGGPSGAKSANETAIEMAREKVIDTGDKAVETDKAAKAEPRDKTFAPGLLDKVSDISAVGAQKEHATDSKTGESKSAASENKNDSHK